MNDKSHSAINTLIDQAVNKVVQTIDTSVSQAVVQGAKLVTGNNGNTTGESSPIVGALACNFDACITPWMEAIRQELREAAAMRLLHRADRLERRDDSPPTQPHKLAPKPQPTGNGNSQNSKPQNGKPQSRTPDETELKGGLG
jgi:hypothetical protein